ncbi:MAG TPA: DUF308 domain-containing protein [Ktedonobacteraceae bacterium]|nr:DUF308 domain-containing protein [Ktedonobacteraceae bacterium]
MYANVLARRYAAVPWWHLLLEGITAVIIGILLVSFPRQTTIVLIQLLGIYWFVTGILALVSLFIDRSLWGWKLFSGILGILAGIVVVRHPLWSAFLVPFTIVIILGVQAIIQGIIELIQAFQGGGWGAALLGVINIIFGIFLLSEPVIATAVFPVVLGIVAIVLGVLAIFGSFRARAQEERLAPMQPTMPTA